MSGDVTRVIRPAAILREAEAATVLSRLEELDVAHGGTWNASPGLWQRYDRPWDGVGGTLGSAILVGTIGVTYGVPTRYEITIYRATVTAAGIEAGWSVESLCNDALRYAQLTLDECPRADLDAPPIIDPFRRTT